MKVYIVGDRGFEYNSFRSVHRTYKGALKAWNAIRVKFLNQAKEVLKTNLVDKDMYQKIVKNLSCKDPKKIDNLPNETPYIEEWDVRE